MTQKCQRILVCGHKSFAATGLCELLESQGHDVVRFSRGPLGREGRVAGGPVDGLEDHPDLGDFDTVINYILLKDESRQRNTDYVRSLLAFCKRASVGHLVHLSSVSVFASSESHIRESSRSESDPDQKGSYGGLKVSTDNDLLRLCPDDLALTFVRPGFILGTGMLDPIIGMAFRLPWNRLLLLGDARNTVPVTSRDVVHRAVARAVHHPATTRGEVVLVLDGRSPTRREYLEACCRELGCGRGVVSFPTPFWHAAGFCGELALRVAGLGIRPYKLIKAACRRQTFDPSRSEARLDLDFSIDWRTELRDSMDRQAPDFELPHPGLLPLDARARRITYIGYGGIIGQRHVPALKRVGFNGTVTAYDLEARRDEDGQEVLAIEGAVLPPSDLVVIASPSHVHNKALPLLEPVDAPVLVEKPLCFTPDQLDEWLAFDARRGGGVFVCHNSRFRANVQAMLRHLERFNPGALHQVDVHFQSPSVSKHYPAWRRDERRARTLLLDYALHFLDVACMFSRDPWEVGPVRYELNHRGQTDLIEGSMRCPTYRVNFLLRQGFIPRRSRLFFTFENYCCSLGFSPDTFVPYMTDDFGSLYNMERWAAWRAMGRKVIDKFTGRESDVSHAAAYTGALGGGPAGASISLQNLENLYRALFAVSDTVYGPARTPGAVTTTA